VVTVGGDGSIWTNDNFVLVGVDGDGALDITNGGTVSNTYGFIARYSGSTGTVTVSSAGSTWTNSSELYVGRHGDGTLDITSGAAVSNSLARIGDYSGSTGVVTLSGAGSTWTNSSFLYVGYSGGGTLEITNGAAVSNTDGYLGYSSGSTGAVTLSGAGATWTNSGSLYVGGSSVAAGGAGTLNIDGGTVTVADTLKIWPDGRLNLSGGTLAAVNLAAAGTLVFQGGTLELMGGNLTMTSALVISGGGRLRGSGNVQTAVNGLAGPSIVATGDLTLGDPSRYDGFNHAGSLSVGNNTVTLKAKGFANIGVLTELDGGTLAAANGVIVGLGANLVGSGVVEGRVAAGFGSTIQATGDLVIGDASAYDGFLSDGVLVVADNTVTINDRNQAVLGSLTELGSDIADGALVADNGLVVEFGKNIIGRGTVDTPNDELLPLMNNGAIIGDPSYPIYLTGYVKGVGTFANVTFSGTISPGLSPVRLHATNLGIGDEGTLFMELGGTDAGDEHDQLVVAGDLHLDGTLQVKLIDTFTPKVGDVFDILDFDVAGLGGTEFDAVVLPELVGRKAWRTLDLYTEGKISVIGMLPGDTNVDWVVNMVDYGALLSTIGGAGDKYTDFNEDGLVDLVDFAIMRAYYGVDTGSPLIGNAITTPEPATMTLLALGALAMLRRRPSYHGPACL